MDFDLSKLRDLSLDDIDLAFLRKREDEAASRGFLGGFLLGVLIGAVIALVFAPRRGDETRELVVGAAGDLKGRATDLVQQVRSDSESTGETATDNLGAGPAIEREIGDAAETFGDTVEPSTDDFGSRPRV